MELSRRRREELDRLVLRFLGDDEASAPTRLDARETRLRLEARLPIRLGRLDLVDDHVHFAAATLEDGGYRIHLSSPASTLRPSVVEESSRAVRAFEEADAPIAGTRTYLLDRSYVRGEALEPGLLFSPLDDAGSLGRAVARGPAADTDGLDELVGSVRKLRNAGITRVEEIPEDARLAPRQEVQVAAIRTGRVALRHRAVERHLPGLSTPGFYLDFETAGFPVPPWPGTRPWQHLPLLYSIRRGHEGGATEDVACYRAPAGVDARRAIGEGLVSVLGAAGPPVYVFDDAMESRILRDLAALFPDLAAELDGVRDRLVDVSAPFRTYCIYHPSQGGRTSLKTLVPLFTGLDYADLEIDDGRKAADLLAAAHCGLAPEEEVAGYLERYVRADTASLAALHGTLVSILRDPSGCHILR